MDTNVLAKMIVDQATGRSSPKPSSGRKSARKYARKAPDPDEAKNPAAVSLGRLGGLKGGKARAKKLTPKRRSEIARKAAKKRWKGHRKPK